MKNKNVRTLAACILTFIFFSCLFIIGCSNGDDTKPPSSLADLKIAGVNVMP